MEAAGWHVAAGQADIFADRHVVVVTGEDVGQPQGPPHLAETRVDVQEHPSRRGRQDGWVGEVSHDVQQESRLAGAVEDFRTRHADNPLAAVVAKRIRIAQPEPPHDLGEVTEVPTILETARATMHVDAHFRLDFIQEEHVPSQPAEAQQVLQEDPSMPAVTGPLGKGTGKNDQAAHASSLPGYPPRNVYPTIQ